MFGILKSFYNSNSFKKFIEYKFPTTVYKWMLRMMQNCRYDKDR